MQASGPVDGDLGGLLVQFDSAGHRPARGELTELVQPVKHRTVRAYVNCRGDGVERTVREEGGGGGGLCDCITCFTP